ncbi:MAG TPA: N-acetyltransferase [Sphaerochaeta sp.]|nr:N-acetyltransferase [Sphaerochaeta sp.]
MVATKTLEQVGIEELTRAYNEGFSDYQITVAMSEEKLRGTLTRNGYRPESSVGLFDGELLVGFVLNGVRGNYCYDSGTAIIPSYRGNGYAHLLLEKTLSVLNDQDIHTWVLEVLCDNARAIKLYRSVGFTRQRGLNCYRIKAETLHQGDSGLTLSRSQTPQIPQGECQPSWQNDAQAIRDGKIPLWLIKKEEQEVGTLCYDRATGSIAQIFIQVEERRKGYAKEAIIEAAKLCQAEHLRLINIDDSYLPLNTLLLHMGFQLFATQLEMTNTLRGKA